MIICFSGAQNARKSTRAKMAYRLLRDLGQKVGFIPEVAGTYHKNELTDFGGGFNLQMKMLSEQIWLEQIWAAIYDVVICDRGAMDVYAYALDGWNNKLMSYKQLITVRDAVVSYMQSNPYDIIYFCKPNLKIQIYDDGVRSTCPKFQRRMVTIFDQVVREMRSYLGRAKFKVIEI